MSDFISPILQWINANPELAGLATFIISAAESIAIIGTIVPGTVMMTAVGTLAGAGVMPLWSTLIWAILGAIVGDGISYWIGYYFKDRLRDIWPFKNYPGVLEKGIVFFNKHGGKSVFIGRFVGPVRALVPLVAGMLHMKPWRFIVANVLSAIGWAPAYMLPGIMLGAASLELPPDIAVHAILMLLLIGLFIILCLYLLIKSFQLISNKINQLLNRVWQRLATSRFFSPITTLLRHYDPSKTHGQLTLAFYFILTSLLFLSLAFYIYFHHSQTIFINHIFFYLSRSVRTPLVDQIMLWVTFLGESKILFPVMIVLAAWLGWKKQLRTAIHVFALGVLAVLSIEAFKHIGHSARPWGITQSPDGNSFPSGHTTFATIFYFGTALLLFNITNKYQRSLFAIAGIIVFAIALSRLYLGAHWLTDILGGLLLGSALLMLIVLSYNRQAETKPLSLIGIITTLLATLILIYGVYACRNYHKMENNYAQMDWPTYSVNLNAWWNQTDSKLPLYRINRFGHSTQLLNLQWLGHLEDIKNILLKNNWEVPPERDWITVLHRISNVQSTEHLPLLSPLYLDKNPVLVLIKHINGNKKLIVLRLWNSHTMINDFNEPLWVGSVELVPSTYSWILKPGRSNEIKLNQELLFSPAPATVDIKKVMKENTLRRKHERQPVLLIRQKTI